MTSDERVRRIGADVARVAGVGASGAAHQVADMGGRDMSAGDSASAVLRALSSIDSPTCGAKSSRHACDAIQQPRRWRAQSQQVLLLAT